MIHTYKQNIDPYWVIAIEFCLRNISLDQGRRQDYFQGWLYRGVFLDLKKVKDPILVICMVKLGTFANPEVVGFSRSPNP